MTALRQRGCARKAPGRALARAFAVLVIALLGSTAGRGAFGGASGEIAPWRIERDLLRFRFVATDNVMDLLAIRPGMTILDIGAGTGQFAREFCRRLNGTGKVYATDTNAACVDHMRREAAKSGLVNLHPVMVGKDGLDPFYGRDRYDLITLFHVFVPYEDRVAYLRELRGTLAEGGRLVLILYKIPTPYTSRDLAPNARGLVDALSRESADSPYCRILRDTTRTLLPGGAQAAPSAELVDAIAGDFNEALSDARFPLGFHKGSAWRNEARFLPAEARYADWALPASGPVGVPAAGIAPRRAPIDGRYSTINKLLIVQRYREYLPKDGLFSSGFTDPIRAAFEAAGFRVEREYPDVIPFEDLVILSARPGAAVPATSRPEPATRPGESPRSSP